MVETFKNISTVGVHYQYMKDDFAEFCKQIFEKSSFQSGSLLSLEFKDFSKSSSLQESLPFSLDAKVLYNTRLRVALVRKPA